MPLLVFRICRRSFQALDGEGPWLYGGRWNTPGTSLVYTATTRALAALEYLAHVDVQLVPNDLVLMTLEVPNDALVESIRTPTLPEDWASVAEHPACQAAGDQWVRRARALGLRVPSAPVVEEENLLVNLRHLDAARVRVRAVRDFAFDPRLLA